MMRLLDLFKLIAVSLIIRINSQVTIAKNTQVTPRCGSQLISIEINFDPSQLPNGKFNDWIVVGVSGRPECRLRGNGETKYIIEIAVFNDPCLTQIPARNVFQNRIRIGKNPVVILEGDQSITVKCVYGLPTVETLAMPVINPNFNIDNLAQSGINSVGTGVAGNLDGSETALTAHSSFSSNQNSQPEVNSNGETVFQSMNGQIQKENDGSDQTQNQGQNSNFNTNFNSFLGQRPRSGSGIQGDLNPASDGMSSTDDVVDKVNRGRATENIPFPNAGFTPSQFNLNTNNPIRPQIPNRLGNEDLQIVTSFPAVSNVPQQPQQGSDNFGLTGTTPKRRTSFSILFILGIIFAVLLVLLLLFCVHFMLRKRREERNRRLLIDGVSSADEGKRTGSRAWWTEGSTDGYASPGTVQADSIVSTEKNQRNPRSATATIFDKRNIKPAESREVPIPTVSVRKNRTDSSTHYSKAGQPGNNRHNSSLSTKTNKKSPAPQPPRANVPLRSNLEEFVSKTYAMGEYNDLASPAYAYTSEVYDEREVDVGFGTNKSKKIKRRPGTDDERLTNNDEHAVSSYRSITEIVHAAETANIMRETVKTNEKDNEMDKVLIDCVMTIRGFGYRKLTEQEIGRWKNLVQRDSYLRDLLISSKSVAEIENIFESDDYRNMFSSTKWHEIAQCVHRALTNSLDRTNSQSQLQLFVGNVQSDW